MKVLREFYIKASLSKLQEFSTIASKNLPNDAWERDLLAEGELQRFGSRDRQSYCFQWKGKGFPKAKLWLSFKTDNMLCVSNIVPIEIGQLSRKQYNGIIKKFSDDLSELTLTTDYNLVIGGEEKNPTEFMSEEVFQKFQTFSGLANKSTGSSHPLDKNRWLDFIISAFKERATISPSQIEKVLVEDEDWPTEQAVELCIEFEFAMELLSAYSERES